MYQKSNIVKNKGLSWKIALMGEQYFSQANTLRRRSVQVVMYIYI